MVQLIWFPCVGWLNMPILGFFKKWQFYAISIPMFTQKADPSKICILFT